MQVARFSYVALEWADLVPIITGERVVLRIADEDDVANVVDYYRRQTEHFKPWFGRSAIDVTEDIVRRAVDERRMLAREDRGYRFHMFLRSEPRTVVGQCSISDIRRGSIQQAVIGYALGEEFQGQGYMTEAVRAAIRFAFDDLDLHRLEGSYMPGNDKSAAILKGCGFEQEAVFKEYLFINDQWRDHIVTSLRNPNWKGTGRVVKGD